MESDLLISAKRYEKERKWDKAIDNLEQIMNQTKGDCDADVYIVYAKSLRRKSKTNQAKQMLKKGLEQHPKNEGILSEFLDLYESLADWQSSEQIALSLININSKKAEYHFRLGRVYSFLRDFKKAKQAYKDGLQHRHKMSFEKLMKIVQSGFTDDSATISSEYTFIDGRNNLGAFMHQYGDQKFLTKISKSSRSAKREVIFYKNICSDFPHLKQVVPSYIDSKVIDKIIYLTIEMIEDDIPIKLEHADKIMTASSQIAKIRYQDIIKKYPNPNYMFQFKSRPISVIMFFTQIHKEYYNERLFSSFYKLLKQNDYPKAVSNAIQKLESLIMDNKLYLFIRPEEHYSLLQGDYTNSNIKIKRENETPIIIDWGAFKIGPHFMDIAKYLSSRFFSYSEMNSMYLSKDGRGSNLSLIEKIFFLYAMSLLYIVTPSKNTIEEKLSDFIIPAIKDIEIFVSQFKGSGFEQVVESLYIERKDAHIKKSELTKKIQTLKKETRKLKKENQNLQMKFNNMLNSKSWKITTPLRKIGKWKENRK